jgi:hypothetical protein
MAESEPTTPNLPTGDGSSSQIVNPPSRWRAFWDDLGILKALAIVVVVSYIGIVAAGGTADETHKNMALMVMAFFFGSSLGSRNKDATPPAPLPPAAGG